MVNVSRPELIDEAALVDAIAVGAALRRGARRVREPRNGDQRRALVQLARDTPVVLTAHMASATLRRGSRMGETVIVNIRAFIDGARPPHRRAGREP